MGEAYLREQEAIYTSAQEPQSQAAQKAFQSLAQLLLSSNEFLYVD